MKRKLKLTLKLCVFLNLALLIISCKKTDEVNNSKKVTLNVSAQISNYEIGETIFNSTNSAFAYEEKSIKDTIINLNDDYTLQAELIPIERNDINNSNKITRNNNLNIANDNPLNPNIYYKLIVYKTIGGAYVTERLYRRGNENDAAPILLDGAVNYTFIAISVNSSTSSNELNTSYSSTTLSTANFAVTGDQDLLFFKDTKTISGEANDYLSIVFKHQFNEITVSIDAAQTGYFFTSIDLINLKSSNNIATINFSNTNITRTGSSKNTALTFANPIPANTTSISSNPIIYNTSPSSITLSIEGMTIGELAQGSTANPITVMLPTTLTPGKKYTLQMTIVPKDAYMPLYGGYGYDAVRINGKVWMRHNLGVANSVDPDVAGMDIHGNYYQWGRLNHVIEGHQTPQTNTAATPLPSRVNPPGWISNPNNSFNAWNASDNRADSTLGYTARENNPQKSANDPCPTGYRVPSRNDVNTLHNNVSVTHIGSGEFESAVVLTSRRKSTVKMTIPKQAYTRILTPTLGDELTWQYDYGSLSTRGQTVHLWTSGIYLDGDPALEKVQVFFLQVDIASNMIDGRRVNSYSFSSNRNRTTLAMPIRCVAINSTLPQ